MDNESANSANTSPLTPQPPPVSRPQRWTCPRCGESLLPAFTSCWKCADGAVTDPPIEQAEPESIPESPQRFQRRRRWTGVLISVVAAGCLAIFGFGVHSVHVKHRALVLTDRAFQESQQQHYDRAIELASEAIELVPDLPEAYRLRAFAQMYKKNYTQVIADTSHTIALNSNDDWSFGVRGSAYHRLNKFSQAFADYSESIRLRPTNAVGFASRGVLNFETGNLDDARADLNQALKLDPNEAYALGALASLNVELGRNSEAVRQFTLVLQINPTMEHVLSNRSMAYFCMGDFKMASADINHALKENSNMPWNW